VHVSPAWAPSEPLTRGRLRGTTLAAAAARSHPTSLAPYQEAALPWSNHGKDAKGESAIDAPRKPW
jgi:hypothetical protein